MKYERRTHKADPLTVMQGDNCSLVITVVNEMRELVNRKQLADLTHLEFPCTQMLRSDAHAIVNEFLSGPMVRGVDSRGRLDLAAFMLTAKVMGPESPEQHAMRFMHVFSPLDRLQVLDGAKTFIKGKHGDYAEPQHKDTFFSDEELLNLAALSMITKMVCIPHPTWMIANYELMIGIVNHWCPGLMTRLEQFVEKQVRSLMSTIHANGTTGKTHTLREYSDEKVARRVAITMHLVLCRWFLNIDLRYKNMYQFGVAHYIASRITSDVISRECNFPVTSTK